MSRYRNVAIVLGKLDHYQTIVNAKKNDVTKFLRKLKKNLENFYLNYENLLTASYFIRTGSSYESSVVKPDANFNIILVLPSPFCMDVFETIDIDNNQGVFRLRYLQPIDNVSENSSCSANSWLTEEFLNARNFLKVEKLREAVFDELLSAVNQITPEASCKKMPSSFRVKIDGSYGDTIVIDIIPQIGVNCIKGNGISGWNAHYLPQPLQEHVNAHDYHAFFTLSCPPRLTNQNYNHLVVQSSFSLFDKELLLCSDTIRNSVRLVKAVAKYYHWNKKGLYNLHVKRLVVSIYDELEGCCDPWNGYQRLLSELSSALNNGIIESYFVVNQNIYTEDIGTSRSLANDIRLAKKNINPSNILKCLTKFA